MVPSTTAVDSSFSALMQGMQRQSAAEENPRISAWWWSGKQHQNSKCCTSLYFCVVITICIYMKAPLLTDLVCLLSLMPQGSHLFSGYKSLSCRLSISHYYHNQSSSQEKTEQKEQQLPIGLLKVVCSADSKKVTVCWKKLQFSLSSSSDREKGAVI